jgi:hypothetical protein
MSIIEVPPLPRVNNGGMRSGGHSSGSDLYKRRGSNWIFCGKTQRGKHIIEIESVNSVSKVDQFARVFFPVSFMAINVFYWYSYLYKSSGS